MKRVKVPTFKFHGSKCRIAKWIFSYVNFPVNDYYEPFAGRGNSFFYFATKFKYNNVFLNDKYMYYFLSALKNYSGNYQFVPDWIDRPTFERFRDMPDCLERDLAESFCAYNGTFYDGKGANITNSPQNSSKNKYSKKNTIERFKGANQLLKNVELTNSDYKDFLNRNFSENDLIYNDPPYLRSENSKLAKLTINHEELANILVKLNCKVIVSDYNNPIYDRVLSNFNKTQYKRASCGRNNNGTSNFAIEQIWYNF
jgi:site-specific DNA-adenine methylase